MSFNPLQTLQTAVSNWAEKQFPNGTADGKCAHLIREAKELRDDPTDLEEMADCLNLILHLAKMAGYNAAVLIEAGFVKLEECKERQWPAEPDAEGVYHHLEATTIPDDKLLQPGDLMDALPSARERQEVARA